VLGLGRARPWRAARRFKRAIRSSSKLRTCRFPAIKLLREIIDLNDLRSARYVKGQSRGRPLPVSAPISSPGSLRARMRSATSLAAGVSPRRTRHVNVPSVQFNKSKGSALTRSFSNFKCDTAKFEAHGPRQLVFRHSLPVRPAADAVARTQSMPGGERQESELDSETSPTHAPAPASVNGPRNLLTLGRAIFPTWRVGDQPFS
jgi:hypothetical protein